MGKQTKGIGETIRWSIPKWNKVSSIPTWQTDTPLEGSIGADGAASMEKKGGDKWRNTENEGKDAPITRELQPHTPDLRRPYVCESSSSPQKKRREGGKFMGRRA